MLLSPLGERWLLHYRPGSPANNIETAELFSWTYRFNSFVFFLQKIENHGNDKFEEYQ